VSALAERKEEIKAAHERFKEFMSDEELRLYYESKHMYMKDRLWEQRAAREEGILEGKLEGKREGKLEGKLEALMLVVKNLRSAGMEDADIQKTTGLSDQDFSELNKSLKG
jgi:predicted transposase/invertase (TIGR01784 family)